MSKPLPRKQRVINRGYLYSRSGDDIKKLFVNFSRLADHKNINKQGTGLGLSICKHLIEQMGGEVRVES